MNKLDIELNGIDELKRKLEEMGRKASKIENEALRAGAEPILKDAKQFAPVRTGKGKEGLSIGKIRRKKGKKYITVGIDKDDNSEIFYMKFQEFGTSKMQAQPFLSPAYELNKNLAQKIITNELKKGLKLNE